MTSRLLLCLSASTVLVACGDDSANATTASNDSTTSELSSSDGATGTDTGPSQTTDSSDSGSQATGLDSSSGGSDSTGEPTDCGNNVIDDDEVCDGTELVGEDCVSQGFDGGELACASNCMGFNTGSCTSFGCGNGIAEPDAGEVCDTDDTLDETCVTQGFSSGDLGCAVNCMSIDVSTCGTCGNVIVDGAEVCDDIALFGQTCVTQGFDSGDLRCGTDCLAYDQSGCGVCENGTIDGAEVCDAALLDGQTCLTQGFTSGTMACAEDCLSFDTEGCGFCGNEVIDGDEICDGEETGFNDCNSEGFDNGTLGCTPDCLALDTSTCGVCGNGVRDGSESCDGADLSGNTCENLGLGAGDLGCQPNCFFDFADCEIEPGGIACDDSDPPNCFPAAFMAEGSGLAGNLWAIALDGSETINVGPLGVSVTGLAFHPDGTLYATVPGTGELGTIDTATADYTPIGATMTAAGVLHRNIADITFVGTELYGWTRNGDDLATIDTATAEVTIIPSPQFSFGTGLAYNSASAELLLSPQGSSGTLFTIDDTGAVTPGPLLAGVNGSVKGMAYLDGLLYGLDAQGRFGLGDFVTYDPDTGARTFIATLPVATMDAVAVYDLANFVAP